MFPIHPLDIFKAQSYLKVGQEERVLPAQAVRKLSATLYLAGALVRKPEPSRT